MFRNLGSSLRVAITVRLCTRLFLDRPVFAWLPAVVIVLIGGAALPFLPIDPYLPLIPPTVRVTAH